MDHSPCHGGRYSQYTILYIYIAFERREVHQHLSNVSRLTGFAGSQFTRSRLNVNATQWFVGVGKRSATTQLHLTAWIIAVSHQITILPVRAHAFLPMVISLSSPRALGHKLSCLVCIRSLRMESFFPQWQLFFNWNK